MIKTRAFLIADKILSRPAKRWLAASDGYKVVSDEYGVSVFHRDDARIVVVDADAFSFPALSIALREHTPSAAELKLVSPGIIQYFASKMNTRDPIFAAIDKLSRYVVAVQDAPIFRMLHDPAAPGSDRYKHRIAFSAFPLNMKSVPCDYIAAGGKLKSVEALRLKGASPVAVPLVFYHSALSAQGYNQKSLIRLVDDKFDYERVGFDELMLRFPSREPDPKELARLSRRLKLPRDEVESIWLHNRAQWNEVRSKLKQIGCILPAPARREEGKPEYHQFTHLVMSGAQQLLTRVDAPAKPIRYVGLPLFARNGVTIPLGADGIVRDIKDYTAKTLHDRIAALLPIGLDARFNVDAAVKSRQAVVEAA